MSTDDRLLTPAALKRITGYTRYSRQAEWFKHEYGIDVTQRANHSIVLTWATYEALSAKKAGVGVGGNAPQPRVELCFD